MNKSSEKTTTAVLIAIQIFYGTGYIVSKQLVTAFSPLIWAAFRAAIATGLLFGIARLSGKAHPPRTKEFFWPLLISALLGGVLTPATFLAGLFFTTSTNSSVLTTTIPVITLLIMVFKGRETLGPLKLLGFGSALFGVMILCHIEKFSTSSLTLWGDSLTLINCICYALFLVYSKEHFKQHDQLWCTAWFFAMSTVGLGLISIPYWADFHWPAFQPNLIAQMFYGIVGSTIMPYLLTIWTLSRVEPSRVAIFDYLQPVVTTLLAWICLGEQITPRTFLATALIFGGVYLAIHFSKDFTQESLSDA